MTDELPVALYNALRGASVAMYMFVLVQVGYILRRYFSVLSLERKMGVPRAGLLPRHVVFLGGSMIVAFTACVLQNVWHINGAPNYFLFVNPPLFGATMYGLSLIMKFEYRRYQSLNVPPDLNQD